jgi:DeoR/GlpR family transcriptional regulator of sugar metabolism
MALACNLSFAGVKTICLGGEVVEKPSMLFGVETVENASRYKVNKMFFATQSISDNGLLSAGLYDLLFKTVAKNADEIFYLVDHKKLNKPFNVIYSDLSMVNYVISDFSFPAETINKYKNTKFIKVEE